MTYEVERGRLGHEPFEFVELVVDKCTLTAGVAPCTATQTGDAKCFNTRATCNDPANYDIGTVTIRFCQARSNVPVGEGFFPMLSSKIQRAGTTTTAGKGLGARSVVSFTIRDFPHHDRGIDPYINERTYKDTALERGTFWGKWLRRNPYYESRTIKVYRGYLTDPFDLSNFEVEEYDIASIDGPTNGQVKITAKDILIRTYGDKAQYPVASTGTLLSGIAATAASATLTPTGIGNSEYPASGYVAIGSEVKAFTRSGDVLTFTAHGEWGTEDKAHSAGDLVQVCASWSGANVVDVLDELLTTGAGIPSSYIPYGAGSLNWDDEKSLWLSASQVAGILMKPESIEKVIGELSEVFMFDIWWNATAQEVQIKALSPEPSGATINTLGEDYEIVKDSVKIKRSSKDRFTEIRVYHAKVDFSQGNDPENFAKLAISADVGRSGVEKYNANSIKTVYSRWFDSEASASQTAGRLLARFSDTPEIVTFQIHEKDEGKIGMAGRVALSSWQFQDSSGATESRNFQVTKIIEDTNNAGDLLTVEGLTSSFAGRYAFVAYDATPAYSSATEAERDSFAFVCYDTNVFLDGEPAYKII